MSFEVRAAIIEDCAQALELIKELAIFEKAEYELSLTLDEFEKDGFGKRPSFFMYVAAHEGIILGIALCYEKYSTWKGKSIYLEDLIVTKSKRGIGIGKALFERVIREAKHRGSGRLEWQVLDWNTQAIDFYKSYGAEIDDSWLNGRFTYEQLKTINL